MRLATRPRARCGRAVLARWECVRADPTLHACTGLRGVRQVAGPQVCALLREALAGLREALQGPTGAAGLGDETDAIM